MKKMSIFALILIMSCLVSASAHAGLNDGLVAYYPFNGNANDESGNGRNGTVYGAILARDRFGNASSAYSFDGVNDFIEASSTGLPTAERTVSLWFYANTVSTRPIIFGYGGNGSPGTSWWMNINHGGTPAYVLGVHYNQSAYLYYYYTQQPVGEWIHYVATTSPTGSRIFINGELKASNTRYINNTYVNGRELAIGVGVSGYGSAPFTDGNVKYFNGLVDDIRIYNRALSEYEIKQLCSAVSPSSHNYGSLAVGWSSSKSFSVTNVNTENLTFGDLFITGNNAADFIIQNDNCSGSTLAPQETRTFDVVYTATSLGSKSGEIIIPITNPAVDSLTVSLRALVTEICECDLNADSRCDMQDWLLFGQRWGANNCSSVPCACDLNADGRCDMRDWLLFGADWGRSDCPVKPR